VNGGWYKNGLFLSAENEYEERFLKNIEKTITTQIARESKNNKKIRRNEKFGLLKSSGNFVNMRVFEGFFKMCQRRS
jgi:hypothetical protein